MTRDASPMHLHVCNVQDAVTRAREPRSPTEEHAPPKHIEKFVFCLTGPYLVTSTRNEAGWATPQCERLHENVFVGLVNSTPCT